MFVYVQNVTPHIGTSIGIRRNMINQKLPEIIPDTRSQELTDEEKTAMAQYYDNEWIKLLSQLAENKSIKNIVQYIEGGTWTDRQKKTIMSYARIVLGNGLSTTFFTNENDYRMFYDDKALIDCDLTLGMTTFDLTPDFNILLGLINLHFGVESRKSKGGMFLKRIGTSRTEFSREEGTKQPGIKEKIETKIGWS